MTRVLTSSRKPFRILSMILPVFAIGLLGYTGNVLLHASASQEPAPQPSVQASASQDWPAEAASADIRLKVNSATRPDQTSSRVILNVTLANLSADVLQISPGLQLTAQDTTGLIHNYTAIYLPDGASVGGPLQPGASRTENLDFDAAQSVTLRSLSFQRDASTAPITVKVP